MNISPDTPLEDASADKLNRSLLVRNLSNLLVRKVGTSFRSSQIVVGLTGKWGSGKSSVLLAVRDELSKLPDVIAIDFNPWLFQGRDDLIASFFAEVSKQLHSSKKDKFRRLSKSFAKYGEALGAIAAIFVPWIGPPIEKLASMMRTDPSSVSELRRELADKLKDLEGAIVILIDELDRVDDQEIKDMARLIKAVGDLPGISYLVAYDRIRVEQALSAGTDINTERGEAYLQKVIQLPIPLRPLMDFEVIDLLLDEMKNLGIESVFSDTSLRDAVFEFVSDIIDNPRDVKRLVSFFGSHHSSIGDEVNSADLLAYSLIAVRNPALRDRIAEDVDLFVSDPNRLRTMLRRSRDDKKDISERVGMTVDESFERVLRYLFPTFGQPVDQERFGRLSQKSNLLSVLYLENPPFRLSRAETLRVFREPTPANQKDIYDRGLFDDFLGNIQLMLPIHGVEYGVESFVEIAKFIQGLRDGEALVGKNYVYTLRDAIIRLGSKGGNGLAAARAIFDRLVASNDTMITAAIVRNHMFSYGLVRDTSARGGPTIFSKSETEKILGSEVIRYRAIVANGEWLKRAGEVSAIFALEQSGNWDSGLRSIAQDQLSPDNIEKFASLFTPPGWSIEAGTIGNFVDENRVRTLLEEAVGSDEFYAASLKRLKSSLAGGNGEEGPDEEE